MPSLPNTPLPIAGGFGLAGSAIGTATFDRVAP
jgi:hypothetical protein